MMIPSCSFCSLIFDQQLNNNARTFPKDLRRLFLDIFDAKRLLYELLERTTKREKRQNKEREDDDDDDDSFTLLHPSQGCFKNF